MKRILVIEDEPGILENIVETLEIGGYSATGAINGRIGLDLASQHRPDLILCDIMMPELDGYQVLQELRNNGLASIPFMFLTARADRDAQRRGMEIGADDYVTKPFTHKELLAAVQSRLTRHGLIAEEHEKKFDDLRLHLTHILPHEIRSPLSIILGYSELLMADPNLAQMDEIADMIRHISAAGQRLLHVTENFSLYAQIQRFKSASERLEGTTASPQTIIETEAVKIAGEAAREADLRLDLAQVPVLSIVPESLTKIVAELVDNAFKFSKPDTAVSVTSQAIDNTYTLYIEDLGRGMLPEQLAEISAYRQFERKFYEQQGSGLGLIIAKELTELYGGQLTIQSIPGEQTTVTVTLPLSDDS